MLNRGQEVQTTTEASGTRFNDLRHDSVFGLLDVTPSQVKSE